MTLPFDVADAAESDDTPKPTGLADWRPFIPEHVTFAPTTSRGNPCACPSDGALALHISGCAQGAAGQAQPYGAEFCDEYGLQQNVLVTAAGLGAALRGISEEGLADTLAWEADDRDFVAEVRAARGPELNEKLDADFAGATAVAAQLDGLFGALRPKITAAELDEVLDAVNALPDTAAIEAHLQARLDALGDGVTVARAAENSAREQRLAAAIAAFDAPRTVTPPAAPFAVPPAPGAVPPPTAAAPTAPPAGASDTVRDLGEAEAALDADPSDVFAAAVVARHDLRRELETVLDPYLRRIRDTDDRNGEVVAVMKLTRAARTEAVDAALSGRLTLLGLKILDLLPTSRDSKAAWERLREPEVSGDRFIDGGTFIHSTPDTTPAVWGSGEEVLWAEGEGLIVAGPQGVGKSTLAGNLVAAMLTGGEVLGYPVKRVDRILYLAMDRPKQIARALRRQLGAIPEAELAQRLTVWQGPPPEDLAAHPQRLLAMADKAKADVVIVDSLKDAALGLSSDEVGAGWNRARQTVLAAGVDVLELHHDRKANDTTAPAIEKLYGSVWITSGAGSVIHLSGEPGDPIVRLSHLKQPASEVGPFQISHDGATGTMAIFEATDLLTMCRQGGMSAMTAAAALYEVEKPTDAQREKARRKLKKLEEEGLVSAVTVGGTTMYTAAAYNSFQVPRT